MDFDAALAFVRTEVERVVHGRSSVPKDFLSNFVECESGISGLLNSEEKKKIIRFLEEYFWTENSNGHALSIDFKSWYPDRKFHDDFKSYYWLRLKKYWHEYAIIPKESIRATDEVTDEIMDFLGDPHDQGGWQRRGLVMGYVQMGKTTNYSALITKAADAGYRIIIVLAGLTNSLRKQTQERMDMSFVGKSSLSDEVNNQLFPVARVLREIDGYEFRSPFCGTTQMRDVNVGTLRGYGAREGNFADPVLFVTKKHVGVLKRLITWLSSLREGGQLDGPMLVIDDEADNATVNTADSEISVTRTNERIRQLLMCSRRSSYVGYTATPFANIFIHPESNNEMIGDNLFPKHFIKSLEPPTNYIGARDLFSEDGKYRDVCVREIPDDFQDFLPLRHRSDYQVEQLPGSLVAALYEYFLFRAIQILSGDSGRHSSMMINVSRFNSVQSQVYDLVDDLKKRAEEHAQGWAKGDRWECSQVLKDIYHVWGKEFLGECEFSWGEIRQVLFQAIAPIEISLVNMRGSPLDYSSRGGQPLHVIAIGGLALARGLTLEGLAVSYVLRNVGAGDTLLQLGRWFGYRLGYERLCRIHLTESMIGHFEKVSESVEELRDDLIRMEKLNKSPEDFGLKVRESPTGIAITAANKMRSAEPVLLAADYREKHVQAYEIYNSYETNNRNFEVITALYSRLIEDHGDGYSDGSGAIVWTDVDSQKIVDVLRRFDLPQTDFSIMSDGDSLISNYVKERASEDGGNEKWTVAIPYAGSPHGVHGERIKFPFVRSDNSTVYCRQRYNGVSTDGGNLKITEKNVVADLPFTDLTWGEDPAQLRQDVEELREHLLKENPEVRLKDPRGILCLREQPILLVHIFQFSLKAGQESESQLPPNEPVVSLSLGLTSSVFEPEERLYAATVRLMQQLRQAVEEEEDDDVVIDDD